MLEILIQVTGTTGRQERSGCTFQLLMRLTFNLLGRGPALVVGSQPSHFHNRFLERWRQGVRVGPEEGAQAFLRAPEQTRRALFRNTTRTYSLPRESSLDVRYK